MDLIKKAIAWGTRKSPWVIHFNAGACNGCDIEVVDALTPRFDLERAGVIKQGSPRHADVLLVTGAVTLQVRDRLLQIYEQMPSPKFVIAVGACACSGGIFNGCYCVSGGVNTVIPVDAYVPGCAVRPETLIAAVTKLLDKMEQREEEEVAGKLPPPYVPPGEESKPAAAATSEASAKPAAAATQTAPAKPAAAATQTAPAKPAAAATQTAPAKSAAAVIHDTDGGELHGE